MKKVAVISTVGILLSGSYIQHNIRLAKKATL